MAECRLIKTRSGEALHLRYWASNQWRRSGAVVPSGTVGVVRQISEGPYDLDTGQSVPAFVRMEWVDLTQANKVASGWVASNYTKLVSCAPLTRHLPPQREGPLYHDPADDPHDRPLKSKSSSIPLLAIMGLAYFTLFR